MAGDTSCDYRDCGRRAIFILTYKADASTHLLASCEEDLGPMAASLPRRADKITVVPIV